MVFEEQTLGGLIEAQQAATELLRDVMEKTRSLSMEEAVLMQAVSHVLSQRETFFGRELLPLLRVRSYGSMYTILSRFEHRYHLTTSEMEDADWASEQGRRQRRQYWPTELGRMVFGLFTPELGPVRE